MPWRKQFLEGMDELVPWAELEALIEPLYWRRSSHQTKVMLRVFVMQQWFGYSPDEMVQALNARVVLCRFAGLKPDDPIPDGRAIHDFVIMLDHHGLLRIVCALSAGNARRASDDPRCADASTKGCYSST